MKAMVLAAGYGTRFRPATHEIPKPMVPVCNRPLIAHAVDALVAVGIREIVVNLHHLPEQIEFFLRAEYSTQCTFAFSFEPQILGTGGGIRKARSLLEPDAAFYLVNGDTIQRPPFAGLLSTLHETKSLASLLLRRPPRDDRFTPVRFDGRFITGFGNGTGEALMFAGAHAMSSRVFDYLPNRDFSGLTEDVYVPLTQQRKARLAGVVYDGIWFDIGTPRRYLAATYQMLDLMASGELEIPRGSTWDGSSLLGDASVNRGDAVASVIGSRCTIESGSAIARSVLWNDVQVASYARVDDSVIGHGVRLDAGARIANALVCNGREGVEYDSSTLVIGKFAAKAIDPDRPMELRGS